ncbi:MAG: bifunctional DNA-formamidopyrimidine glycosylase/DNA-(apurinic or apyrimidinic site) lyase [Pseudomonadales bacterium]
MPELPEVETTCRGIAPHIVSKTVEAVIVRQPKLRWPIPENIASLIEGQVLIEVRRRAKYVLLCFARGQVIIHLGMSGSLRILTWDVPALKHDHFDIQFSDNTTLRLTDPRRFGAVLWQEEGALLSIFAQLGPEPLEDGFTLAGFLAQAKKRKTTIKQFIMDNKVVVGVGNIYAAEALFAAGINPNRAANSIGRARMEKLYTAIKYILGAAITQGGTTLKDFVGGDGQPGYFAQELQVYGRKGLQCNSCRSELREVTLGQRSSVYCPKCQR